MSPAAIGGLALAAFLAIVGVTHFLVPGYFRAMVPRWVPAPGAAVAVTGVLEIVLGALVLVPATRQVGAWLAAGLFLGYAVVVHGDALARTRPDHERLLDRPLGVAGRLLVHAAYVAWAVWVALS